MVRNKSKSNLKLSPLAEGLSCFTLQDKSRDGKHEGELETYV